MGIIPIKLRHSQISSMTADQNRFEPAKSTLRLSTISEVDDESSRDSAGPEGSDLGDEALGMSVLVFAAVVLGTRSMPELASSKINVVFRPVLSSSPAAVP